MDRNNGFILRTLGALRIEARGLDGLQRNEWYLVLSNHRSWVDILVLQSVFRGRIPFLKFFLKQQLIWVPLLGLAWWALDFPFMRRHSSEYLAQHPEERGKDLESTRKACARFAEIPTSVMNFVEGTRFTRRSANASSRRIGICCRRVPAASRSFCRRWAVCCAPWSTSRSPTGRTARRCGTCAAAACSRSRSRSSAARSKSWTTAGDYMDDEAFRRRFQQWLADLWQAKDARLDALLQPGIA